MIMMKPTSHTITFKRVMIFKYGVVRSKASNSGIYSMGTSSEKAPSGSRLEVQWESKRICVANESIN